MDIMTLQSTSKNMLAGLITGPRALKMIEIPIPQVREDQMLIKLTAGSICGSDLPYFNFELTHPGLAHVSKTAGATLEPMLSLHELVGIVAQTRSARFKEGDRVLALPAFHHQGLAEYFLTFSDLAIPLPAGLDDHQVIAQPLGTVIHACQKLPNLLGQTAVVIGQGPIGLLFTALLKRMGIIRLLAVDLLSERLKVSREMGATETVCGDENNIKAIIEDWTQGKGVDLAIEAVGRTETLNLAASLVRRNGILLAFGVPHDLRYDFGFHDFFYREGKLITSVGPDVQKDFPIAVELIRSGSIDVAPLVTHHFSLNQAPEGFNLFAERSGGVIKVVFKALCF